MAHMKTMQEMSRQTDSYFIVNPHAIQNLKFSKTVLSFEVPVKVKIFTFVFIIIIIIIIIYLFIYFCKIMAGTAHASYV